MKQIKFKTIHNYNMDIEVDLTNYLPTHGIYLEGKLEYDCGFDIVDAANCDSLVVDNKVCAKLPVGIYPVKVEGANPDKECIAFIWTITNPEYNFGYPWMGLIVYKDDEFSYNYAYEMYGSKSNNI